MVPVKCVEQQLRCWGNMIFQPLWNIAHWCLLPHVKYCLAWAFPRHCCSGILFRTGVGRDHPRLGSTSKFYPATLASDLKTSIHVVVSIFLAGTARDATAD